MVSLHLPPMTNGNAAKGLYYSAWWMPGLSVKEGIFLPAANEECRRTANVLLQVRCMRETMAGVLIGCLDVVIWRLWVVAPGVGQALDVAIMAGIQG
jgi:hypothetical protein